MAVQNGDLSNKVSPRILLVFEGALGFCSNEKKFAKAAAKQDWERALSFWEFNELLIRQILWLFHRRDVNTEIVTFKPEGFATELRYRLDTMDIPVHRVWSTSPENLGRQIAYMPDLACVYDPEPERWLMYGSKGRLLSRATELGSEVGYA